MILQKPNEQQHSKTSNAASESANNKLTPIAPDNSSSKSTSIGLLMPSSSSSSSSQMTNAFHKSKNSKIEKDDLLIKSTQSNSNEQISPHLDPNHILSQLFLKATNDNLMKKDINNNTTKMPYNPQYNNLLSAAANQNNAANILQNFSANNNNNNNNINNFGSDYFFNHLQQSLNNQTNSLYSQYDPIAYSKRLSEISSSLPINPLSLSASSAPLNNRFFGANPILNSPVFSNKSQNKETKSCN